MKNDHPHTLPTPYLSVWHAERRMLPPSLRSSDNSRRIKNYKRALNIALKTKITPIQREQLSLFYDKKLSKTDIGKIYGVGSSTVCKTLKAAEKSIKEYIELYIQIYDLFERELLLEENE